LFMYASFNGEGLCFNLAFYFVRATIFVS